MIQPDDTSRKELLERLQKVLAEERDILQQLGQLHVSGVGGQSSLAAQRREAWAPLRGSVIEYGDIVSPIDVPWDAAS